MGTLQHIQHQISAVNDLIRINHDRVTGYEKALEGVEDSELEALFRKNLEQSQQNATELRELIHQLGGDPANGTTLSGKFYRTWLDLKAKIAGKDTPSVLAACDYGEAVAEKAYREALDDKELIWQDKQVVTLLNRHLKGLIAAHDRITGLRQQTSKV
jgi:uncharacterized protein (TIGR02284 family)